MGQRPKRGCQERLLRVEPLRSRARSGKDRKSALCSRSLTTRRMGEGAPQPTFDRPQESRPAGVESGSSVWPGGLNHAPVVRLSFRSFQLPRIESIEPAKRTRNMMIQPAFVLSQAAELMVSIPFSSGPVLNNVIRVTLSSSTASQSLFLQGQC
jgi:hypothetical protein